MTYSVQFGGEWGNTTFYALARECNIGFWSAYDCDKETRQTTMHICELPGEKGCEPDISDFAIGTLLAEYYGPAMRMAYTYS